VESDGLAVRRLCRNPDARRGSVSPDTELMQGDLLQPASLAAAFSGVHMAFYLVHSMDAGKGFESRDRKAATNFGRAARAAGALRIIYLAGWRRAMSFLLICAAVLRQEHPTLQRCPGPRIQGVHRDRCGQRLVRSGSRSGGVASRDDHPALGRYRSSAHRDRGRDRVSGGGDPMDA
jgi:hypothetical protein